MKEAGALHLKHLRLGEPGGPSPEEPGLAAHQGERQVPLEVVWIIVVAQYDRERQPVLGEQGLERVAGVGPLAVVRAAVDHVAQVSHEHDVLLGRVGEHPIDLFLELDAAPGGIALGIR